MEGISITDLASVRKLQKETRQYGKQQNIYVLWLYSGEWHDNNGQWHDTMTRSRKQQVQFSVGEWSEKIESGIMIWLVI